MQIFLTFLVSFVLRALDATPASAAGLGLASFEPAFTQVHGGPAVFYGWVLVGSLGLVLALALGLTMAQLQQRRRWLASTARGIELLQLAAHEELAVDQETVPAASGDQRRDSMAQLDPTTATPPPAEMRRPSSTATGRGGDALTQPLMSRAGGRAIAGGPTPAPALPTAPVPAAVHAPAPEEALVPRPEPAPEPEPEPETEPQ